jgi:Tfp pilus assembly protein PilP
MRSGLRREFAKIIFSVLLATLVSGVMGTAMAFAAPEKVASGDRRKALAKLFHLSGIEQTAQKLDAQLFGHRIGQSDLPTEQIAMLKNVMNRVHEPDEWLQSVRSRMLKTYEPRSMKALLNWYGSPLGKKIVRAEMKDLVEGMTQEKEEFIEQLKYVPPREGRLEKAEQLEKVVGMTDHTVGLLMMFVKALIPFNEQFQGKSIRTVKNNIRQDLYDPMRESILQSFLFKFRHLSDAEFARYVNFVTSRPGRWFFRSYYRGSRDALEKTSAKLERLLDRVSQEMDSEGGESQLLKELVPPGQRYIFARRRDPFVPLVDPLKGLILAAQNDESNMEFRSFADELKKLPPIPLEVYRSIRTANPKLYSQLEYYGGLFKQETKIASMNEDAYFETVNKYKDLLQKAGEGRSDAILTPVQADYESLKLVGVIWKNKKITALIETGDNKGHTINEGDLLGPNFGLVESIQKNEITILERSRDYQGNILSQKREIEFIQESPEEG